MDVHPPHEPIHSARDFFVHLFTITIGLLIALALEGLVEVHHHHELLQEAQANLRDEIRDNRAELAKDRQQMLGTERSLTLNIELLQAAKAHHPSSTPLSFQWYWDGMQTAAWDTARNTGAIALMSYDHAQTYSVIYGQQASVDEQASVYIHDIYRSGAPLQGGRKITDLTPEQIDIMIASTQQAIADIKLLTDLCDSLDHIYARTSGKL